MKTARWSFYAGRIAGVPLFIHWTFVLLLFIVFLSGYREKSSFSGAVPGILFLLALFGCVVLHELGHIAVAKRYGYPAKSITLYPVGGVARMERLPRKPWQEFWMALAGPWVNVVIAALLFFVISYTKGVPEFSMPGAIGADNFLQSLLMVNIYLAVFNLLPAFPMDGGRILRALLSLRMERVRATQLAAKIGRAVALVFIVSGLFFSAWLTIIGVLVFFAAGNEALHETHLALLSHHTAGEVMMHRFTLLTPGDTLGKVIQLARDSHERTFVVVSADGKYGTVTIAGLLEGLKQYAPEEPVSSVMKRNVLLLDARTSLSEAWQEMLLHGHSVCPVFAEGKLAGILDMQHINEFIAFTQVLSAREKDSGNMFKFQHKNASF